MKFFNKFKNRIEMKKKSEEQAYYLQLIGEARERISRVRTGFDEANTDALCDYFIYERKAAEAHFQYLMKLYSEKNFATFTPPLTKTPQRREIAN